MAARVWLAVALSCLVWFGYVKWFAVPPVQVVSKTDGQTSVESPASTTTTPAPSPFALTTAAAGDLVELRSDELTVQFGSSSGDIHRVWLNEYSEGLEKNSPKVHIVSPSQNPGALALQWSDPSLKLAVQSGIYRVEKGSNAVTFLKLVGPISIKKSYSIIGKYLLDWETVIEISNPRSDRGHLYLPLGGKGLQSDHNNPLLTWEAVFSQDQNVKRFALEKITEPAVHQGVSDWFAFGNRYFVAAVLNRSSLNPDIVLGSVDGFAGGSLRYPLGVNTSRYEFRWRVFLGPKDLRYLNQEPALASLVDHGMFSFFARPILFLLNFFHGFVHNYGVAIILLTLLVRLLFYPLSLKSYRYMRAMQKLQPQLLALKEKHKEDRERFNQEQLALFKAHGVNPAGGCLPMLVQLPVFIALYAVLQNSIELFHAPFFGWVKDLSAKDSFYVYPALMGIAMFLQQKMTPTPGMDPMQQKMMLIMPVIFTFMMLNLPAGLTLYIFLSTLLGIIQQWAMNREKQKEARVSAAVT